MVALPLRSLVKPSREGEALPVTLLDGGMLLRGRIEAEGEVHVRGRVIGRIDADRVVIGARGSIEGDIVAREVRVLGRFSGRIFALNVIVEETAELEGRIFHNTVAVARGAHVDARMPWRPPSYFETLDQLPEARP